MKLCWLYPTINLDAYNSLTPNFVLLLTPLYTICAIPYYNKVALREIPSAWLHSPNRHLQFSPYPQLLQFTLCHCALLHPTPTHILCTAIIVLYQIASYIWMDPNAANFVSIYGNRRRVALPTTNNQLACHLAQQSHDGY